MKWLRIRIVKTWLTKAHDWADGRIRKGDFDFDDVVYRTRDAAKTLLDIWFPVELSQGSELNREVDQ